jgi:sugar lactone lactonase YvrE
VVAQHNLRCEDISLGAAMFNVGRILFMLYVGTVLLAATFVGKVCGQASPDPNSYPNPYRSIENWAKLPSGRTMGETAAVAIDQDGKSVWVFERCGGATCVGSGLAPILEFDASGGLIKSFGAGLFVDPHGIFIDKDDNVWVTDTGAKDGKGQQVFKFSPDGKFLMSLGKPGVGGEGQDAFNQPSAVLVAPNGDIFVADGHGDTPNARIVKFSADGKFIKEWGKKGVGPGEFGYPHSLAMDSGGKLFVADPRNNRIEIFDQDGKFIGEWHQFGRPNGIFIDKEGVLYATDAYSDATRNPGFKRGIRIGSAKDGKVTGFIELTGNGIGAEGVAADDAGNVYGGEPHAQNAPGPHTGAVLKYARNPAQ